MRRTKGAYLRNATTPFVSLVGTVSTLECRPPCFGIGPQKLWVSVVLVLNLKSKMKTDK